MSLKTLRLNERNKRVTRSHEEENRKKKEQSWVDWMEMEPRERGEERMIGMDCGREDATKSGLGSCWLVGDLPR